MLLTQGTELTDAIIRSSPLFSAQAGSINKDVLDGAERINVQTVFGSKSNDVLSCDFGGTPPPVISVAPLTHCVCMT